MRARLSTTAQTPAHEVDQWTLRLATAQRQDTEAALLRLTPYESLIRRILAREQVPQDLIYLALIESHYKPSATSSVGAAGIWQFMPRTARSYGLEVSTYVDERRDPVRSTQAAARHLRDLHRQFGSWHLAAAAYNAGGGRISRALSSHGGPRGGDELLYWQVRSYLPRETREYVPKLLAAVRIGREPLSYGIAPPEPATPLNFRLVWAEGGTSLDRIARASGASTDEVRALNPHLIRSMTPPGRRWPVRVPPISTSSPATDAGYSLKGSTHSVHPPVSLRSSTRDAPQARAPHDRVTS